MNAYPYLFKLQLNYSSVLSCYKKIPKAKYLRDYPPNYK
ncbi:hypothetical protein FLAVO9AF_170110 [Flavobacterium sp. 9AF]|nr:hypothetical protein FLAVO9AF_170110 [Flavobacterium sp. 9AF]